MITACMCVNACVRVLNINNTSKKGKREDSSEERRERERDMVKSIHRYALVSIDAFVEHIVTRTSTRRRLLTREIKEET